MKTEGCNVGTEIVPNTTDTNGDGSVPQEFSWFLCIAIVWFGSILQLGGWKLWSGLRIMKISATYGESYDWFLICLALFFILPYFWCKMQWDFILSIIKYPFHSIYYYFLSDPIRTLELNIISNFLHGTLELNIRSNFLHDVYGAKLGIRCKYNCKSVVQSGFILHCYATRFPFPSSIIDSAGIGYDHNSKWSGLGQSHLYAFLVCGGYS
jgi:hypothetical protein